MSFEFDSSLKAEIRRRLDSFTYAEVVDTSLIRAAVAILVVNDPDTRDACFVLTRRPAGLNRHGGQYALPGGRMDPGEDPATAALREVQEEVGLKLKSEVIIGRLDDFPTRSGFSITPVVMWGGANTVFKLDPNEVDALFKIPLWDLARPEIPRLDYIEGSEHPVLSAPFETLGHRVYAPTAAILYQFREVGLFGRSTKVDHFEQPRFAWQ